MQDGPEETQPTHPAKGEPTQIPVPKRRDVLAALEKVAKPRRYREAQLTFRVPPSSCYLVGRTSV